MREVPAWASAGFDVGEETAGEALWRALPGEAYTLGFGAAGGSAGRVGRNPWPYPKARRGSLEAAFLSSEHPAALLDFTREPVPRSPDGAGWRCRVLALKEVSAELPHHLDGLVILRSMEPATE